MMMRKIKLKFVPIVALVALMAFNVIGIHHHHHEKAVPIVVELLACDGADDASHDDCCAHGDGHSHASKCNYQLAAVKLFKINIDKSTLSQMVGVVASSICAVVESCIGEVGFNEFVPILKSADLSQSSKRGPPEYSFFTTFNQIINSNCVENEYQKIISFYGGICRHGNGWML